MSSINCWWLNYMSMWQYSPLNPSVHTQVNPATSSCADKLKRGRKEGVGRGGLGDRLFQWLVEHHLQHKRSHCDMGWSYTH